MCVRVHVFTALWGGDRSGDALIKRIAGFLEDECVHTHVTQLCMISIDFIYICIIHMFLIHTRQSVHTYVLVWYHAQNLPFKATYWYLQSSWTLFRNDQFCTIFWRKVLWNQEWCHVDTITITYNYRHIHTHIYIHIWIICIYIYIHGYHVTTYVVCIYIYMYM